MSYEEVERGLPPVDEVPRGTFRNPQRHLPVSVIHPTWAPITPAATDSSSAPSTPRLKRRAPSPALDSESSDGGFMKKRPAPPSPTQRYLIQDGDGDDFKVIKLDSLACIPGTLEPPPHRKPRVPGPKLVRQGKTSLSLPIPTVRVTASSPSVTSLSPSTTAIARRAKHFIIFLLTLLPPKFFTVAVHFLKANMVDYGVAVLGLCLFQAIAWPALIFLVFNKIWMRLNVLAAIRRGWLELLVHSKRVPV